MEVILISGKAGHGKDTLAGFLKELMEKDGKSVLITHYGDLLKHLCRNLFNWDGKKDEHGRHLLQYVGTDVIRKQDPDYWVKFMHKLLELFKDEWDYVLIPDTRFPNEIEGMADFNPKHIRIVRPGFNMLTEEQQKHPSETALDNYSNIWEIVANYEPIERLRKTAEGVYKRIKNDNCR